MTVERLGEFTVSEAIDRHLGRIYPTLDAAHRGRVGAQLTTAMGVDGSRVVARPPVLPASDEVVLITYGDSIVDGERSGFAALGAVLDDHLADVFSAVHVLPFFPSSSDGGFSVVDYRAVKQGLGGWPALDAAVGDRRLMVDLVCNHGSTASDWFAGFLRNEAPYRDWFKTADPDTDLRSVVRPRTHPLLLEVDTAAGPRHVWATFSHDQVDYDFSNPEVLVEFCSILAFYLDAGATRVRLDAIAYLWKRVGTSCVHLAETHEVVKLMRTLADARDDAPVLITETNVPHAQNVSYFGTGDEAHMVYNFTLAPLIVWTVLAGQAGPMSGWLGRLEPPPEGCAFLNFLASHDGLGLRPIEGLVDADDLRVLLDAATDTGGGCSMYDAPGGPRPYEVNVSLADVLAGIDGATRQRFVVAHALMLAVQGVPAVYVHSMFSTPGDVDAVARTGHRRDINRVVLDRGDIDRRLENGWRAEVFEQLSHLIRVRRRQPAFSPTAAQIVHVIDDRVAAIERRAGDQRLLAVHNVSGDTVAMAVPAWADRHDVITGTDRVDNGQLVLGPWQACWLSPEP